MTTGSLMAGTVDGMAHGVMSGGAGVGAGVNVKGGINIVKQNPNNILTVQTGSDIAYDIIDDQYFMGLAQNGSTWIHLVSGPNP